MKTFKIIGVDNLARETVADSLVYGLVPDTPENRETAAKFCDWLNTFSCDGQNGTYYQTAESDYRLSRGMEDLV